MENKELQDTNILLEKETLTDLAFEQMDWGERYLHADRPETVVEDFIDAFLKRNDISEIGFQNALEKQLYAYGPDALKASNPFLKWILLYANMSGKDALRNFTDEQYEKLNHLYAEQIINDSSLSATSNLGKQSLIFVQDFFNQSYADMKYLMQIYTWLNSSNNASYVDKLLNAADGKELYEIFQTLGIPNPKQATQANLKNQNWSTTLGRDIGLSELKNFFCFENMMFDVAGKLRSASSIYSAMDKINDLKIKLPSNFSDSATADLDKDLTPEMRAKLENSGITKMDKTELGDVVNYLLKLWKDN